MQNDGGDLIIHNAQAAGTQVSVLDNGNVGIGTVSPSNKLEVNGTTKTTNLQMTNGATNGYTITSDASGNASWVNPENLFFETAFETSGSGGQTIAAGEIDLIQLCLVIENVDEITADTRISATFNITCADMSTTSITLGPDNGLIYDGEISGSNFVNTTFSTHGTSSITSASAPYTGTFTAS